MISIDNTLASVILGCITVLITLVTVTYSWKKDRNLKTKREADNIRMAASKALRGIERWKSISCSIFHKSDILFVEVAENIKTQKKIPSRQIEFARDLLWKKIYAIASENKTIVFNEDIENSYIELFSYIPNIKSVYKEIWSILLTTEELMLEDIAVETQQVVMNINDYIPDMYHSAILGNQLRSVRSKCEAGYVSNITTLTEDIINKLTKIISEKDYVLIKSIDCYKFDLKLDDNSWNTIKKNRNSDYRLYCNSFRHEKSDCKKSHNQLKRIFLNSPDATILCRKNSYETNVIENMISDNKIKYILELYGQKNVLNAMYNKIGSYGIISEIDEDDIIKYLIDKGYKVEK